MHGSLVLVVFYSPIYIYIFFLPSVLLPERQASSGE